MPRYNHYLYDSSSQKPLLTSTQTRLSDLMQITKFQCIYDLRFNSSTSNMMPMMSDLEQIPRGTIESLFYTTLCNPWNTEQKSSVILDAALESEGGSSSSRSTKMLKPVLGVPPIAPGRLSSAHIFASRRQIDQEENRHVYGFDADKLLIKVAVLLYLFQRDYQKTSDGLGKSLF